MNRPLLWGAVLMTIATSAILSLALSPMFAETSWPYVLLGLFYGLLTYVAYRRAQDRGQIAMLRPRSGDISIGVVTAGVLYVAGMGATFLFAGKGTSGEAWTMRIYGFLGNPLSDAYVWLGVAAGVVGLLEEISWRGLVFPMLREELGTIRGALWTTVLYTLAHAPSAILLADPIAGPNPFLLIAALGGGFVWVYLTVRLGRIGPSLFAHAVFTWAVVEFPLWRAF